MVAFMNDTDRFVPEWGELLGLGEVRRQPYLSSGLVFLGHPMEEAVLALMAELQDQVDFDRTFWRANERDYPFLFADQDVFNAILASRIAERAGGGPAEPPGPKPTLSRPAADRRGRAQLGL